MKNKNIGNMKHIFLPAWVQILTLCNPAESLAIIYKKTTITYSHIYHVIIQFEKAGFVIRKKKGRIVQLTLTPKGMIVLNGCEILTRAVNEINNVSN